MNIKVTGIFVGMDEQGEYNEVKQVYLIPSPNFCDAEKATLALIKDNEDPKADTVNITAMAKYSIDQVIYKDEAAREVFESNVDMSFFEVVMQLSELVNHGKIKKVKHKMLIEAKSIDDARIIALDMNEVSGNMFDERKILSIKEVEIYKSLI